MFAIYKLLCLSPTRVRGFYLICGVALYMQRVEVAKLGLIRRRRDRLLHIQIFTIVPEDNVSLACAAA